MNIAYRFRIDVYKRQFDDNWGLEDPTGKSDEEFKKVIDEIRMQIFILKQRLDEFEEN